MKYLRIIVIVCVLLVLISSAVSADSLAERFNFDKLSERLEEGTRLIIVLVRTSVALLTVLLIISVGVALWQARDAQVLEIVKVRITLIFIGLMFVFFAEPIVNLIFHILGKGW